eukprot:TRINITY_DN5341_c0_g4_i1.p1 TRINITY_DN5341_c0_g4~~TRINITY_DN5341_c0_g4_i1.p1  ORF type:complete len:423 (-),score=48.65 TRINITY_DN5341_c0_g4_i1:419-1687(-)
MRLFSKFQHYSSLQVVSFVAQFSTCKACFKQYFQFSGSSREELVSYFSGKLYLQQEFVYKLLDQNPQIYEKNIQHVEEIVTVLKDNLLIHDYGVGRMINQHPKLLFLEPCELEERLTHWIRQLKVYAKGIAQNPQVLTAPISEISFNYRELGQLGVYNISHLIRKYPQLLLQNLNKIEQQIEHFQQLLNASPPSVCQAICKRPSLAKTDADQIKKNIDLLTQIGFNNNQLEQLLVAEPHIFGYSFERNQLYFKVWKQFGLSDQQLSNMIHMYPAALRKNPLGEIVLNKLAIFQLKLNVSPEELLGRNPQVLGMSFERQIAPRICIVTCQQQQFPENFSQILVKHNDRRFLREAVGTVTLVEYLYWINNQFQMEILPKLKEEVQQYAQNYLLKDLKGEIGLKQLECDLSENQEDTEEKQVSQG